MTSSRMRSRVAALVAAAAVLAGTPVRAFDVEVHYAWTYYLALQVGYTPRQAFQIASATVGVDGDVDTNPVDNGKLTDPIYGATTTVRCPPDVCDKERLVQVVPSPRSWHDWLAIGTGTAVPPSLMAQMAAAFARMFILWAVHPDSVEITTGNHVTNLWSRIHAFAETLYVGSGRPMLSRLAPSPDEVALVPDVQATREAHQLRLWQIGLEQGNPGAFFHFLQDSFAHGPYDNLRGHAFHGHLPDFLSWRPSLSLTMTRRTIAALQDFLPRVGGTARPIDEAKIRRVLERMIEANPRPSVADPRLYDPGLAPMLPFPFSDLQHIGSPVPERSWDVVRRALEADREAGRLPRFPDVWFDETPPAEQWLQYDFDATGRARAGGINDNRFPVEQARITFREPEATVRPAPDSPNGAQIVTLKQAYAIEGLSPLPFMSELPVIEDGELSDFGAQQRRRRDRGNGTFTIEHEIRRSPEALAAGITWRSTVYVYGFEPHTAELKLPLPAPVVPDLRRVTMAVARERLASLGLTPVMTGGGAPDRPELAFTVASTEPAAGTPVPRGASVRVRLFGPFTPITFVPEVVGQPRPDAERLIRGAQLRVTVVEVPSPSGAGRVVSVEPGAGSRVQPDSTVTMTVAVSPPPPPAGPSPGPVPSPPAPARAPTANAATGNIAAFSNWSLGLNNRNPRGDLYVQPTFRVTAAGRVFFRWGSLGHDSQWDRDRGAHPQLLIYRLVAGTDGRPSWTLHSRYGGFEPASVRWTADRSTAATGNEPPPRPRPPAPAALDLPPGEYLLWSDDFSSWKRYEPLVPGGIAPAGRASMSFQAEITGPVEILSRPQVRR